MTLQNVSCSLLPLSFMSMSACLKIPSVCGCQPISSSSGLSTRLVSPGIARKGLKGRFRRAGVPGIVNLDLLQLGQPL